MSDLENKQLWLHKDAFILLATASDDPDVRGIWIFWGTRQDLKDLAADMKDWIAFDVEHVTERLRQQFKKAGAI